jgi:pyruvate kinase
VANAILDGTDALMLSEETAIGKYPVESVQALSRIAQAIEAKLPYDEMIKKRDWQGEKNVSQAIAYAACMIADEVNAIAIIAPTRSGASARFVASHWPKQPIIAITSEIPVARKLKLSSGVYPFVSEMRLDVDNALKTAKSAAGDVNIWKRGESVVITSGPKTGMTGKTDRIKVERIS